MSPRACGVVTGMTGFFAGAVVASIVRMEPLSKAAIVGAITGLVSTLVWAFVRPKSTRRPMSVVSHHANHDGTFRR
jgi:hypothetical protein